MLIDRGYLFVLSGFEYILMKSDTVFIFSWALRASENVKTVSF